MSARLDHLIADRHGALHELERIESEIRVCLDTIATAMAMQIPVAVGSRIINKAGNAEGNARVYRLHSIAARTIKIDSIDQGFVLPEKSVSLRFVSPSTKSLERSLAMLKEQIAAGAIEVIE